MFVPCSKSYYLKVIYGDDDQSVPYYYVIIIYYISLMSNFDDKLSTLSKDNNIGLMQGFS